MEYGGKEFEEFAISEGIWIRNKDGSLSENPEYGWKPRIVIQRMWEEYLKKKKKF